MVAGDSQIMATPAALEDSLEVLTMSQASAFRELPISRPLQRLGNYQSGLNNRTCETGAFKTT